MNRQKLLVAAVVWLVIISVIAIGVKWYILPKRQSAKELAKQEEAEKLLRSTGSDSQYKYTIQLGIDSFSGYYALRSPEFATELRKKGIKLGFVDDGANYSTRLADLDRGRIDLAVFTVDALIKSSAEFGRLPATIVAVIDETRGADAIVGYKQTIPNVDALNNPETRFVITPNSPSETLVRVLMSRFNLNRLDSNPFIKVDGAEAVYKYYRNAKPESQQVFVVWEPYVTKIKENPNIHTVIDSSRFRGYIVDVLVVSRDFLIKNEEMVQDFIESYFRAHHQVKSRISDALIEDSRLAGNPLTSEQANNLIKGIWWKNTQENYCHLGIKNDGGFQHIEDMIANCSNVLLTTKAIASDPTNGKFNLLYYKNILANLASRNFHPEIGEVAKNETVKLKSLTEKEWQELRLIGTLEVPTLIFARGSATLTEPSKKVLDELKRKLDTFPFYYLSIKGHALPTGDVEVNKILATSRAKAAETYLVEIGVENQRIRSLGAEVGESSSVMFTFGEVPY